MRTALLAAVVVCLTIANVPAAAQQQCFSYQSMQRALAWKFNQRKIWEGFVSMTQMIEVYRAPNGRWTIVSVEITGRTCVRAYGFSSSEIYRPIFEHPGMR